MKRLCAIIFLLSTIFISVNADDYVDFKTMYKRLDTEMAKWPEYVKAHERKIAKLKLFYQKANTTNERYRWCSAIVDAYQEFQNDSALFYVDKLCRYADTLQDKRLIGYSRIKTAYQAAKSGLYAASLDYLNEVDTLAIGEKGILDYYRTRYYLMGEMSSYCYIWEKRDEYVREEGRCRKEIMKRLPKNSGEYLMYKAYEVFMDHQYEEAMKISDQCLKVEPEYTPIYKLATFHRRFYCECLNQPSKSCYWLAQSAISEMRLAITDQLGLWSLASKMKDNELDRQYKYIRFSWDVTKMFGNSSVRSWQITPVLSTIEHKYQEEISAYNQRQQLFIILLSATLIILMVALYLINSQRKHIARTTAQLAESNQLLKDSNEKLRISNDKLKVTNGRLADSSRAKEEYIVQLLEYNSDFIDQKEEERVKESKMLRTGKMKELTKALNSPTTAGKELDKLLARFDEIFLSLYPTFIDDFNALLNEDGKIKVTRNERMNTPLRIFALLRLGIEKTADVSKILHCSANTVYNYRAQLKNAYRFGRDGLEDAVRSIGMPF